MIQAALENLIKSRFSSFKMAQVTVYLLYSMNDGTSELVLAYTDDVHRIKDCIRKNIRISIPKYRFCRIY